MSLLSEILGGKRSLSTETFATGIDFEDKLFLVAGGNSVIIWSSVLFRSLRGVVGYRGRGS